MELGAGQQSIDHWALGIIFWSGRHMNLNDPFSSLPLLPRMLRCMFGYCFRDFVRRFETSVLFAQIGIFLRPFCLAVHPVALFIHTLRER
jgi:hypothetical protein